MSPYQIVALDTTAFPTIMNIWESAVKATHHFLEEGDFLYFQQAIPEQFLPHLTCYGYKTANNTLLGFIALNDKHIEMLFIHAGQQGKGIGKCLVHFAIAQYAVTGVDVNEQNEGAIAFYHKMGFRVKDRSETDGTGKPYPILHMKLADNTDQD